MSLADFEFKIAHMLTPLFVLVTALIVGKLVLYFVDSLAAMMIFKVKGYRLHDNVRINGEIATITKIGLWTTNFELANGDLMIEFLGGIKYPAGLHDSSAACPQGDCFRAQGVI